MARPEPSKLPGQGQAGVPDAMPGVTPGLEGVQPLGLAPLNPADGTRRPGGLVGPSGLEFTLGRRGAGNAPAGPGGQPTSGEQAPTFQEQVRQLASDLLLDVDRAFGGQFISPEPRTSDEWKEAFRRDLGKVMKSADRIEYDSEALTYLRDHQRVTLALAAFGNLLAEMIAAKVLPENALGYVLPLMAAALVLLNFKLGDATGRQSRIARGERGKRKVLDNLNALVTERVRVVVERINTRVTLDTDALVRDLASQGHDLDMLIGMISGLLQSGTFSIRDKRQEEALRLALKTVQDARDARLAQGSRGGAAPNGAAPALPEPAAPARPTTPLTPPGRNGSGTV